MANDDMLRITALAQRIKNATRDRDLIELCELVLNHGRTIWQADQQNIKLLGVQQATLEALNKRLGEVERAYSDQTAAMEELKQHVRAVQIATPGADPECTGISTAVQEADLDAEAKRTAHKAKERERIAALRKRKKDEKLPKAYAK